MGLEQIFDMDYAGARDTDTHRVCGSCGELKPVEAFYRDGKDSKGNIRYRRDCRECYKRQRILESKMKEKHNEKSKPVSTLQGAFGKSRGGTRNKR